MPRRLLPARWKDVLSKLDGAEVNDLKDKVAASRRELKEKRDSLH